jgi:hypothetical protein
MERAGKQVEVLIHGKKKSQATIRKETKRHAYSGHSRSIQGGPYLFDTLVYFNLYL